MTVLFLTFGRSIMLFSLAAAPVSIHTNCAQGGQQDGLGGKSACCQALEPEFNPQDLLGGRREMTPRSCPLTSRHALCAWS